MPPADMPMPRLLDRIRTWLGLAPNDPQRPLRLLLIGSAILPAALFAFIAWQFYQQQQVDARDRLERTLGMIQEHAVKVFETFAISERYLEEAFRHVSDDDIQANEAAFSARIRSMLQGIPQIRDLWVIDAHGHPLVSGTIYPMPRKLELADRDYFKAHLGGNEVENYVSEPVVARLAQFSFFAVTRKRLTEDGRFNGVYLVSISPDYFVDFYSRLPRAQSSVAALVRGDGTILARYPDISKSVERLSPNSPVLQALRAGATEGVVEGLSSFDKAQRVFAFKKLPNMDVMVITGIEQSQIRADWMRSISAHLLFGIPATIAMFALGMIALRRSQREASAHAQLRAETARRQITEQALQQAQKMEAVGRLTGGIAHDFNNLLTAIGGNIDLAARRLNPPDERIIRTLNAARQASQRAATLVQRLLAFSRQHPQEVRAVDINRLVQGMSELLHRTLSEGVTIETVLGSGLWKCAIDPNQLENAIINLAVNARDAMPNGGRLTIETANAFLDDAYAVRTGGDFKPGQFIMVAVSDTGTGITPEVRDKIFEPFFTTKAVGAGSGLGLSMVYGFVKQSGGHVQVYTEPGEGTSFKLYFPRLPDDTTVPAWEAPTDSLVTPAQAASQRERILLVEDDEDVRRYVAEALRDLGYRVETAPQASTALTLLETDTPFDLLFTDVVLPGGMNGRQLAERARELRPHLRVLFATGYTRNAIIHHGRLDADVNLLVKPFTPDALERKLRQIFEA
ncbi:MAG: response regulator [Rhizobiales bacterium]|mgnify:FL=1|nr:response regulator [Hyphomicrobiales bacterium]